MASEGKSSSSEQQPTTSRKSKHWAFGITFLLVAVALVFGISFMAAGSKRGERSSAKEDNNATHADNTSVSRSSGIQEQELGAKLSGYGRDYDMRNSEKGLPGRDQVGRAVENKNYKQNEFGTFRQNKLPNLETGKEQDAQPGGYLSDKEGASPYQQRLHILHSSMKDTAYRSDEDKEGMAEMDLRGELEIESQRKTKLKWYEAGMQDGKYNAGQGKAALSYETPHSAEYLMNAQLVKADRMTMTDNSKKTVCNTTDCEYMRWLVNVSVDTTRNPCSNFYDYVCGKANKEFEKDASMVKGGMLHIITERLFDAIDGTLSHASLGITSNQTGFEKVAALFTACHNRTPTFHESERDAIVTFLTEHEMVPTGNLTFDPLDKQFELMFEGFSLAFRLTAIPVMLRRNVKFILSQPGDFGSLRRRPKESSEGRQKTYEEVFKDIFPAFTFNETMLKAFLTAEDQLIQILNLNNKGDQRLIPMSYVGVVLHDKGLSDKWIRILEKHTKSRLPGNYALHASEEDIHLIHNLFGSRAMISTDLLRKLLAWRAMFLLYITTNHVAHRTRKDCLHEAVMGYPFVALSEAMFRTEEVTKVKVVAVDKMTQNIFDEIGDTLNKSPWLDSETRLNAYYKLTRVNRIVGFPLGLWSDAAINHYMMDVPDVNGSFLASTIEAVKAFSKRDWELFLDEKAFKPVLDYFVARMAKMYQAKATYVKDYNAFVISPAVMSKPVFINGGPPEVNYGALGRLVGAEIMYAFDETGRKYGAVGEPDDWFTNRSKKAYDEKVWCHSSRLDTSASIYYGNYPQYLTDIMSADSLLRAYKTASEKSNVTLGDVKGLTSDQLFYVSWCLLWCGKDLPGEPPLGGRCNLPLMNSEHFSAAFGCSIGAPMNAAKKCHFW